jgi:hypothetical protein
MRLALLTPLAFQLPPALEDKDVAAISALPWKQTKLRKQYGLEQSGPSNSQSFFTTAFRANRIHGITNLGLEGVCLSNCISTYRSGKFSSQNPDSRAPGIAIVAEVQRRQIT